MPRPSVRFSAPQPHDHTRGFAMARAVTPPPKKSKKGGPSCPICECWNCGIISNFLGKLRSKKDLKTKFKPPLCKTSVLENILGRFVFGKKSPPSPVVFRKMFCFPEKILRGSPNGRVPKFFNSPPPPPLPTRYGSRRPWVFPFICNDYILKYFNVKRTVQQCRNSSKNFGSKKTYVL